MKKIFFFSLFLFMTSCHIAPPAPPTSYNPPSYAPPNDNPTDTNQEPGAPTNAPNAPGTTNQATTRTNELLYDLTPDVITSLTCSGNISFGSGYYALSFGSYYEGLRLADTFKRVNGLDDIRLRKNSKVSQSESTRIIHAINNNPLKGARAELSIRDKGNIYSVYSINNRPLITYFPILNSNYIFSQLSQYSAVLSTRPIGRSRYNSSPFKSHFRDLKNSDFVRNVAPNLFQRAGDYMITLTYSFPTSSGQRQSSPISNAQQQPYGKSYTLDFNSGRNIDYLTDVYEENLLNSRRGRGWHCPSNLRLMVHRSESERDSPYNKDVDNNRYPQLREQLAQIESEGYCDVNDNTALTEKQKNFLSLEFGEKQGSWPFKVGSTVVKRDGRSIKLSDTPCIVIPRGRGSCYNPNPNSFYRIEFDPDWLDSCKRIHDFSSSDQDYSNTASAGVYAVCPAWLSMCYREEERN